MVGQQNVSLSPSDELLGSFIEQQVVCFALMTCRPTPKLVTVATQSDRHCHYPGF